LKGARLSLLQQARVKEMIAERLDGNLSTAVLAAECSLSISEFNKAFERNVGVRPDLWLAERRVERAMLLLRSTTAPLTDIAVESGFFDRRHMTRVFLKMVGVDPSQWRSLVRH
jgi:AraC family transcriptional regulator